MTQQRRRAATEPGRRKFRAGLEECLVYKSLSTPASLLPMWDVAHGSSGLAHTLTRYETVLRLVQQSDPSAHLKAALPPSFRCRTFLSCPPPFFRPASRLQVWDLSRGSSGVTHTLTGHTHGILGLWLDPNRDGTSIVSGGFDSMIRE
jgi:hypothetical protein